AVHIPHRGEAARGERFAPSVILRGCEEILSEGGAEGRERRIFGYTGSTLPTERRRNHRPRCATNRTVCAIGPSPAGVTEDPSLLRLGPTPLRISSQPLSRGACPERSRRNGEGSPNAQTEILRFAQDDGEPNRCGRCCRTSDRSHRFWRRY